MPTHYDGTDARVLDPLWESVRAHVGQETLGHPLLFVVSVMTTVVVAGLAFSIVDVFVTRKQTFRDAAKYLAITLPGYLLVFVLLNAVPFPFHFEVPDRAPTLLELARDLVVCMVVGDLLSYAWHRLEHGSRFVFRNVHYVHHSVRCPLSVWSGFYVHPIESLTVFCTFYVYPFVMQVHPITFAIYAALNTFITMVTHCGYDLPLYPNAIFASGPMHDPHHGEKEPVNFCVLLTLGDRLFGTYVPPRRAPSAQLAAAPPPGSPRELPLAGVEDVLR